MMQNPVTLTRLGSARDLTRHEPFGDFVEIGLMRSKTPI